MDAADELAAMIAARLEVLRDINKSTFNSAHPTNCGPVARWIEDMHMRITRFNLRAVEMPVNPAIRGEAGTVDCEFSVFGMPPQPGTMTISPDSDMARFESADGKTKTWVHRSVLAAGDIEWPDI